MQVIDTVEALEALFDAPSEPAVEKVTARITPLYRAWIDASKFCVLSTVGCEGTDGSPRGDAGPVVRIVDETTVWMPDWRGNNRLDSLRNIVRDGRVSVMFMVPGSDNVVRLNGHARLTADAEVTGQFEQRGRHPKVVIAITVRELYFQCAKAIMRSGLWTTADIPDVPTAGDFLQERLSDFDGSEYDLGYADHAKSRMW